jgi:hypothetical protein
MVSEARAVALAPPASVTRTPMSRVPAVAYDVSSMKSPAVSKLPLPSRS